MGIEVTDGIAGEEPPFVKMYIKQLMSVKSLGVRPSEVFMFMVDNMSSGNNVSFSSRSKESFMASKGMSNTTFNTSIRPLIDSGLIKRVARGDFIVNKKYIVKVDWKKVQSIKWETTFDGRGVTDTVEVLT